jgi:hypothetical protein
MRLEAERRQLVEEAKKPPITISVNPLRFRVFYKPRREDDSFLTDVIEAYDIDDAIEELRRRHNFDKAYVILDIGTWVEGE